MKKYIALLFLIVVLSTALLGASALAYAAIGDDASVENFDDTYVLNDLKGATVWNKTFDIADYPYDPKGELRLLEFAEYMFSTKFELRYHYGLYVYVYNPRAIPFEDDEKHNIEIADEYTLNYEGQLVPSHYDNYHLTICSASADNLFYKFKIDEVRGTYDRVAQTQGARRYDVVSLDLVTPGDVNASAYSVGGTWTYSGYAQGCHASSMDVSTLQSEITSLTTLLLNDLRFTYYRTWKDMWVGDQLTSVYFSVPEDVARDYDRLYSIQAETYQYLTSPIVCIYDRYIVGTNGLFADYDAIYNDLLKQRHIVNPYLKDDGQMDRILYWDQALGDNGRTDALTGYNFQGNYLMTNLSTLAWVFQVSKKEDYSVTSSKLLQYMQDYSDRFDCYDIRDKYAADLFADRYYSYFMSYRNFTSGKVELDIDISGKYDFSLVGSSSKYSFWKALFGKWDGSAESDPISPIIEVAYSDIKSLDEDEISEKYYIASDDVGAFKTYLRDNQKRRVYLFRFSQSDYFSTPVANNSGTVGYMAQEVAYLDFDIISMGYEKDGVVTIIPVVSAPIDIIGGVEPGQDPIDWGNAGKNLLTILLAIGLIILVVWLLAKVIGTAFMSHAVSSKVARKTNKRNKK